MKTFLGRRRVALLVGAAAVASGAGLLPAYAAGPVTVVRDGNPAYGWEHFDCNSGADLAGDLPVPVLGPAGVPHGAGSVEVTVPGNTYTEFDLPQVQDAAALTAYPITVDSPDGVVHLVAGLQFPGQMTTFLMATLTVPANTWQTIDLTQVTFVHMSDGRVHWWDGTQDDSGDLAHFVAGTPGTDFRPALAVLGCQGEVDLGTRTVYLDVSTVTSDANEGNAGTIDHEPTEPPTPAVSTSSDRTITYGRSTTLSTVMTYASSWPLVEQPWELDTATPGSAAWTATATGVTGADGSAQQTVKPSVNTSYGWVHPVDSLGYFLQSASGRTEVTVRSKVISKLVDTTVRRGSDVKVTGTVGPKPPTGTSVTLWRWGKRHVRLEQATVGKRGKFAFATKAAKAGTLPLRVTVGATATNAAGHGRVMKVHVSR